MDPLVSNRPILSFSHAINLLLAFYNAGLIKQDGTFDYSKASDANLMKKRLDECADNVNWKARGFKSRDAYLKDLLPKLAQA